MFLHLGADVVVSLKEVISILDLRTAGKAEATREFLQACRAQNRVVQIADGEPKSVVVTDRHVYLSPISSLTLKKRSLSQYGRIITKL
ncbi:MAG: DUF370 domain-containing protein [Firmicutes bacterium]|nr:DUF370 domain-containing protein [Bacillota bacterium]